MRFALDRVDVAFTDREGGVSTGPWASLNLGTGGADDPSNVEANLKLLAGAMGVARIVTMRLVNVVDVAIVGPDDDQRFVADALVTDQVGVALLVRVADCLPVVLADADAGVIAVAHAGRKGMQSGVVINTVTAMRQLEAERISAWMGPRACGNCYEVPAQMADEVATAVPAARSTTSWRTPALDIGAGVENQLRAAGVQVHDLGADLCTIEDERLFSYRRQGIQSGRFGAVVVLR